MQHSSPTGGVRAFLEASIPFGGLMTTWLAHVRASVGEDKFQAMWKAPSAMPALKL